MLNRVGFVTNLKAAQVQKASFGSLPPAETIVNNFVEALKDEGFPPEQRSKILNTLADSIKNESSLSGFRFSAFQLMNAASSAATIEQDKSD